MRDRVVLALAAILTAGLVACGGAAVTTPATGPTPQGATDAAGATEASDGAALTLTLDPHTSPGELRESMEDTSARVPVAQLPQAPEPSAVAPSSPESEGPPTRAVAAGEPHEAPPSVSSDPVGVHLITTTAEVDTAGDARLRHSR